MPMTTHDHQRSELEKSLRQTFESRLPGEVERRIEDSRDEREECLADELEAQMRQEFEDGLDDAVDRMLEEVAA